MKKVAVIGAGAAGLNAARHLKERQDIFRFTVFEQTNSVGGTWVYNEDVGVNSCTGIPIHSSMYRDLRTNLPIECMSFPGFPFPKGEKSFAHHSVILKYLESYCQYYKLHNFIKFSTRVALVKPSRKEETISWDVAVEDVYSKEITHHEFDAVMVCVGRYSTPKLPKLAGIEFYSGRVVHSHDYRTRDPFVGETVVVLGAGPSGTDIVMELATVAQKVFLCHDLPRALKVNFPENVHVEPGIQQFDGDLRIVLKNGKLISATSVILCTGYQLAYNFLSDDCHVSVSENVVLPLYKHMFHVEFCTLAFIGLPVRVIPFIIVDYQNIFFLKTLEGLVSLPCPEEMRRASESDLESHIQSGCAKRHYHCLPQKKMWDYLHDIATICNLPTVPQHVKGLYSLAASERELNCHYKDMKIKVLDDGTVTYSY